MMQINLLPWREKAREVKKKRLMAGSIASALIAVLFIVIYHFYLSTKLSEQEYVNTYYQSELQNEQAAIASTKVQQQERLKVEEELKSIVHLYNHNYAAIRLLNEIANIVPDEISLTRLVRRDRKISLEGSANTDGMITDFLQTLKKSPIFLSAELSQITSGKTGKRNFEIALEQKEELGG